jgi:hypothetical protein
MQEIHEYRDNREIIDRLVGVESDELKKKFEARRAELEKRIEDGETQKATIKEHRRIGRNDPCPCGSGVKFKKCCGSRLPDDDARLKVDATAAPERPETGKGIWVMNGEESELANQPRDPGMIASATGMRARDPWEMDTLRRHRWVVPRDEIANRLLQAAIDVMHHDITYTEPEHVWERDVLLLRFKAILTAAGLRS